MWSIWKILQDPKEVASPLQGFTCSITNWNSNLIELKTSLRWGGQTLPDSCVHLVCSLSLIRKYQVLHVGFYHLISHPFYCVLFHALNTSGFQFTCFSNANTAFFFHFSPFKFSPWETQRSYPTTWFQGAHEPTPAVNEWTWCVQNYLVVKGQT